MIEEEEESFVPVLCCRTPSPSGVTREGLGMQSTGYGLVISMQLLLLVLDLFVNSFSELFHWQNVVQLVLFM